MEDLVGLKDYGVSIGSRVRKRKEVVRERSVWNERDGSLK